MTMTTEVRPEVGTVNLLTDVITKDREIPKGYDGWLIRSVHPDLRSSNDYRYPFPGKVAKASGPFTRSDDHCPSDVGDGICAATTWAGMASGGIPATTLLLVAYKNADLLDTTTGDKRRLRKFLVVELVDGARLLRQRGRSANLQSANLRSADLRSADLRSADLRSANLRYANLQHADLRYVVGLTQSQIDSACGDGWTQLPSGLVRPASWT